MMIEEITNPVVAKLVDEQKRHVSIPPSDLKKTFEKHGAVAVGTTLGTVGGIVGTHIGLAGVFGAIPATWPLAGICLVLGGFAGAKLGRSIEVPHQTKELEESKEFCPLCGLPKV